MSAEARTDESAGNAMLFVERQPWPEPISGAELLSALSATLRRFVVLSQAAADAVALWVLFTYCIAAVHVAPILAIVSPEKRCGKSTLLSFLIRLCFRALPSANISPSAVFRGIEKWAPTLLIDEADTFLRDSEEMRGVLNSGHARDSAFVIRTVGDDHEPMRFSTWGAKEIALIGKLPDTLHDRAIVIELRRKLADQKTEKLRHAEGSTFETLARQCARFAADHAREVAAARPAIPDALNDRAADNWEPLFAIAEAAGGQWPEKARGAALVLSGETVAAPESLRVLLLGDIRDCFDNHGKDRIVSTMSASTSKHRIDSGTATCAEPCILVNSPKTCAPPCVAFVSPPPAPHGGWAGAQSECGPISEVASTAYLISHNVQPPARIARDEPW